MITEEAVRYVTFRVGRELFAIDVANVEQVLRYEPGRRMPRLPAWIDGIIEHQGKVVPLIDLRKHFDVAPGLTDQSRARLLLLSIQGEWCVVAVDEVLDVRPYDLAGDTPDAQRGLLPQAGELYIGMVKRGDDLVAVLDAAHVFSSAEREGLRRASRRRKPHDAASV